MTVEGRAAVVTGGSRGIGLAIAADLLAHGASVTITARDPDGLDEALTELDAGDRAIAVAGNTDDPDHRREAVAATVEAFGAADLLVNNAATNPQYGPIVDADLGAVDKVLQVNLVAPLAWAQETWSAWMAEHGGAIVNVASVGGLRPGPMIGAYNASKAALIHLTRQLAIELGPTVRVNGVAPALVKTRFARALWEDREDEVGAGYPLGRIGAPEDVAPAARFLLSDEAAWITGQTLVIDGGAMLTSSHRESGGSD